jgi:hypothetical protein
MDTFITTVMVIYDNINKESQAGPRLINNKITEKQFLAYYIYRIWIKYRKLMEDVNTPTDIRRVLKYMEVPKKYHEIYLTYPMANKMPINEKQLDLIILSMLKQLNQAYKLYGPRPDGTIPPENKDYKMLNKYLTGKTIENIIQDVIQIKLLVPNLSRPANVRNIWEGIDQMLDDIDVVEPVVYENPETEIPDSKLSGSDSGISNMDAIGMSNKSQSDTLIDAKSNTISGSNTISSGNLSTSNKNIAPKQSNKFANTLSNKLENTKQNNKPGTSNIINRTTNTDIQKKQNITTRTNIATNLSSSKSNKNSESSIRNNTSSNRSSVKSSDNTY